MKKWILLCVTAGLAAMLAGCGAAPSEYNFKACEIESVDVFTGAIPAAAVEKIVTLPADIERVVRVLGSVRPLRQAGEEDMQTGGIGYYFRLRLTDGTTQVRHIGSGGDTAQVGGLEYKIRPLDFDGLWKDLNYKEILVGEEGLPDCSTGESG